MVKLNGKELTEKEETELKKKVMDRVKQVLFEEMGIEIKEMEDKNGNVLPLMTIGFLGKEEGVEDEEDFGFGGLGWFPGSLLKYFFVEYSKELVLMYIEKGKDSDEDLEDVLRKMGARLEVKVDDEKSYDMMYG